jgi:two-component system response regulator
MQGRMMEPKRKPILLVDDNADDELLTLDALRSSGIEHPVVVARDGLEAIEWLYGQGMHAGRDTAVMPRLILLDLKLPKINGLEVLSNLRRDNRTRYVPTVILSSSTRREDIDGSYQRGANSYLRKAVNFEEYSVAVQCLCEYWLEHNQI